MIKTILSKVMWIGRTTVFAVGLAVTLALMLGVATAALAAVPGDPFRLGKSNTINRLSVLVGGVDNALLKVDNNSAGPNATAVDLHVEPDKAPMKVNSDTRVANFNADKLDGRTADDFYYYNEKVNDSEQLDGKDSTNFLPASIYSRQESRTGTAGTVNYLIALCDPGDLALSAGYVTTEDTTTDTIYSFARGDAATGGSQNSWDFRWYDRAPATHYILTVYCADTTNP